MTRNGPDPRPINEAKAKKGTPDYDEYRKLYKAWNLRQSRRCRNDLKKKAASARFVAITNQMARAAACHPPQSLAHPSGVLKPAVLCRPMGTPVTSHQDTILTSGHLTLPATTTPPVLLLPCATTTPPVVAPPPVPPAALHARVSYPPHPGHPTRIHPAQSRHKGKRVGRKGGHEKGKCDGSAVTIGTVKGKRVGRNGGNEKGNSDSSAGRKTKCDGRTRPRPCCSSRPRLRPFSGCSPAVGRGVH